MVLAQRSTAPERMDTDCADYEDYRRCLRDLSRLNTVTLTRRPTLAWLRRQGMRRGDRFSLLDVAFGYGDMLRTIAAWARSEGLHASLTGADLNPWAARAAREAGGEEGIDYRTEDAFALSADVPVDFIISAQFTHHLTDAQVIDFIRWMEARATRGWFISDLHRHGFAYYGFPLLARIALWHEFVRTDGQISIARSFRPRDWRALLDAAGIAPDAATIRWHLPFRLCVARTKSRTQ
jgi:2-polyprenyl-3-methyl-5-hydroxy-6-metoxy-1,4-benzoquinol methylase